MSGQCLGDQRASKQLCLNAERGNRDFLAKGMHGPSLAGVYEVARWAGRKQKPRNRYEMEGNLRG